jgi:cation:H+ antiporter
MPYPAPPRPTAAMSHRTPGPFGETVLTAATALPEISTAREPVHLGHQRRLRRQRLPARAVIARVEAGLPQVRTADISATGVGLLLTVVFIAVLLFRPRPPPLAVLVLYVI